MYLEVMKLFYWELILKSRWLVILWLVQSGDFYFIFNVLSVWISMTLYLCSYVYVYVCVYMMAATSMSNMTLTRYHFKSQLCLEWIWLFKLNKPVKPLAWSWPTWEAHFLLSLGLHTCTNTRECSYIVSVEKLDKNEEAMLLTENKT